MFASTRSKSLGLIVLAGALVIALLLWWATRLYQERTSVVFLDVDQGDAILISQGNYQVLIDSGRSGKTLLARLGRHMPFWDRRIEVAIPTHPDADHIGGFADLFRAYQVPLILSTGVTSDTEVAARMEAARATYGEPEPTLAGAGTRVTFPKGGELVVLYPEDGFSEQIQGTNQTSLVARFTYGETDFLLTGDLAREEEALSHFTDVEVLKVAHHGSKSSTSTRFLELVTPEEAVISVGQNSYGHPAPEVLERLNEKNIIIRRTDTLGDIRYLCQAAQGRCAYRP